MREKVSNLIDQFIVIDEIKSELSALNEPLTDNISYLIQRTIDSFKHNLTELLESENENELIQELNRKIII